MELYDKTAHELRVLLDRGEVRSVDIVTSLFERIDAVDGSVGSFLALRRDEAMAEAREADRKIQSKDGVGPLTGIPVGLKDNLCTDGAATTCASKMLERFIPPYDATVVRRLRSQGAPILGKTNMDEFAMGSSTETSAFKITKNPWDLSRVPGGSSGGSAAAVAAQTAIFALGSDTGGSIRQPAALCGVVGMKPTYGRVSRYGLIAFASSLDQIGPFAKDVRDAAMILGAIAGHDPLDATSVDAETPDYTAELERGVKGLKVGLPAEYFGEGIAPDVKEAVTKAVKVLEALGATVVETSIPNARYALSAYYMIAPAEASSNLARFDGVRYGHRSEEAEDVGTMFRMTRKEGFGAEVKRRIMLGTYALSAGYYDAYYLKALKVRTLIRRDFETAFESCDVLAMPTTPTTAFKIGEKTDDPMEMYQSDLCTVTANLTGAPAITVPCGTDGQGLPVGLQLVGPAFSESTLLQAAYAYEQAAGLVPFKPRLEVAQS